ncbi:MAG TPA: hypothetical protein DDZ80_12100, partial [Cyanobacteria bacterium UBA8803]|nr:hypothetical protein [Cyanobacteria bacterium UBA8803]
ILAILTISQLSGLVETTKLVSQILPKNSSSYIGNKNKGSLLSLSTERKLKLLQQKNFGILA